MSGEVTTDSHRPAVAARCRKRPENDPRLRGVTTVELMVALAVGMLAQASLTIPPAEQTHPSQERRPALQGARARSIHLPYPW